MRKARTGPRVCTVCHAEKAVEEFYIINKATGRISSWCKECKAQKAKEARIAQQGDRPTRRFDSSSPFRICSVCHIEKPAGEFYIKDKKSGRTYSWCKLCHVEKTNSRYFAKKSARLASQEPEPIGTTKVCTVCGKEKDLSEFNWKNRAKGYRKSACRECTTKADAQWKAANIDHVRQKDAEYRAKRRMELVEKQHKWREANPDRYRQIHSKWKRNNKDTVNALTHKRRAQIAGGEGSYTAADWEAIKQRQDYRCLFCGKREPDITLTVDHIVPVSQGGSSYPDNLQGLCKSCNSKKWKRIMDLRFPDPV